MYDVSQKIACNLSLNKHFNYLTLMPRRVSYRIEDRPDGLFDVVATIQPDKEFRCDGFATLAEVEAWVEGLRFLMASLGAPVTRADSAHSPILPLLPARS